MGFAPDIGSSFDVDLTEVDQTQYAFLNSGDARDGGRCRHTRRQQADRRVHNADR